MTSTSPQLRTHQQCGLIKTIQNNSVTMVVATACLKLQDNTEQKLTHCF